MDGDEPRKRNRSHTRSRTIVERSPIPPVKTTPSGEPVVLIVAAGVPGFG